MIRELWLFVCFPPKKFMVLFFFESNVNVANYLEMLQNWFWMKHLRTEEYKKYMFQQDGERPRTSKVVKTWLSDKFCKKFISKEK